MKFSGTRTPRDAGRERERDQAIKGTEEEEEEEDSCLQPDVNPHGSEFPVSISR
jgi:hypothetical protein